MVVLTLLAQILRAGVPLQRLLGQLLRVQGRRFSACIPREMAQHPRSGGVASILAQIQVAEDLFTSAGFSTNPAGATTMDAMARNIEASLFMCCSLIS